MFFYLLIIHSWLRWLLVLLLPYMIIRSAIGYHKGLPFTKTDNSLRHWTATVAHVQLMIGMILYFKSPLVSYFWHNDGATHLAFDYSFFSIIHIALMLLAVVVLTIGSAMAKRKVTDRDKFKTVFTWFLVALLILFIAIPWPFSPLAERPFIRNF